MYITNVNFADSQQLGSQMYQYACLYTLSKHYHSDIYLFEPRNVEITTAFDITLDIRPWCEAGHLDIEYKLFNNCDELNLNSTCSWNISCGILPFNFWESYKDEIIELYTFKNDIFNEATRQIKILKEDGLPLVSLHVRRTDYINNCYHVNLDLTYYSRAISFIKGKLVVFSDDIEYCKQVFKYENICFIEGNTKYVDMCMMSLCDHNIIANSTFSFWGAYLNKNPTKTVICPSEMFLNNIPESCLNGKFPSEWISLLVSVPFYQD